MMVKKQKKVQVAPRVKARTRMREPLDDKQWANLLELLSSFPRLQAILVDHEHRKWFVTLVSKIAKWVTTVGAAVLALQVAWSFLVKWTITK